MVLYELDFVDYGDPLGKVSPIKAFRYEILNTAKLGIVGRLKMEVHNYSDIIIERFRHRI